MNESAAGEFRFSAFGSAIAGQSELTIDIDAMNVANINVCCHGGQLLALWEPGSAYALDPGTLETLGVKQWNTASPIRPFSAHPKIGVDGRLWNFGCDPVAGVLSVYVISATGLVEHQQRFVQTYDFGSDWMLEEHVYAAGGTAPGAKAGWVVGTALNLRSAKTVLSVFAADAIQDGPVAQAALPYALPVGLHGVFLAGS